MMRLEDLRKEFAEVTIGPQIWELLVELSQGVARSYPESVYNAGSPWTNEAVEELVQDVVVECLLGEGQLQYIFDGAETMESFRKLTVRQIRRTLIRRRSKTVVDRLLTRVEKITSAGPFKIEAVGKERWITRKDASASLQTLDNPTLRRLADELSDIPRLPQSTRSSRTSMVYAPGHLRELVDRVVERTGGITYSDLAKILEILLTAWLPTFLDYLEESEMPLTETVEDSFEVAHVREVISDLANSMDGADCIVLLCKSQNVSDSAIAERLSRSRPWVADKKSSLLATIEAVVTEIPAARQSLAFEFLLDEAAVRLEGGSDENT